MSSFRRPLIVVLLLVAIAAGGALAATLPKDPCVLLKPADVQVLAPKDKIGDGVVDASALPLATQCRYTWGPRTKEWGESELTVVIMDASKAFQGLSPETIAQGVILRAKTKDAGPDAAVIPGIGDAAVFTYEARPHNAMAEAYIKKKDAHIAVTYHGDSLANKDKVIALLKLAADRL